MKKISVLFISALFSVSLLAQNAPVLGLKGGLNLATWDHSNSTIQKQLDSRLGFHLGLLIHNHLTHNIAIQPEIQFSTQGTEVENGANDIEYRTSHINVPVMFQYMFNNGFRIEAGPQVGFMLGARDVDAAGNEVDRIDEYNRLDFGLGFGLNYLTYSGIGVGGRYNLGLSNINDVGTTRIQNRVLQLSIFYMIDSRHKAKSR